jgi:hypothetical protein
MAPPYLEDVDVLLLPLVSVGLLLMTMGSLAAVEVLGGRGTGRVRRASFTECGLEAEEAGTKIGVPFCAGALCMLLVSTHLHDYLEKK